MIYSRSAEYAIRACVHLARVPDGKCAMVRDIAQDEKIPAQFLAKILQMLARKGLLRSTKGPAGGFCLDIPSRRLKLLDIVAAVDGLEEYSRCIAGHPECSDATACPMHKNWIRLRSRIMGYLGKSSIFDLARTSVIPELRDELSADRRRSSKRV